jgi:membrane-associated protease RseP (regulator of RpoE activity)
VSELRASLRLVLLSLVLGGCAGSTLWVDEFGQTRICGAPLGPLSRPAQRDCERDSTKLGFMPLPDVELGITLAQDGNRIAVVHAGSPAEQSGLREGDRLERIGETRVRRFGDVVRALSGHAAGDEVEVAVTRASGEASMTVRLESR